MAKSEKVQREIDLAYMKRDAEVESQKERDWVRHEKATKRRK